MIENKQAKAFRQNNLPNQVSIGEENDDSSESVSQKDIMLDDLDLDNNSGSLISAGSEQRI